MKDMDLGYSRIKKEIKEFKNTVVEVGILADAGFNKGERIVDYATANEFGTDIIPERSFIRSTTDERRESWADLIDQALGKIVDGKSNTLKELAIVGLIARDDIKAKITSNIAPENAPSTKLKKAGSENAVTTTLIDTGRMRDSIHYKLEGVS